MAITKLSNSGIATGGVLKYDSMLAGNAAYVPPTFESIATVSVTSVVPSVEFTSIPSTFTHLQVRAYGHFDSGVNVGDVVGVVFNSDNAANYSWHLINGQGGVSGQTDNAATHIYSGVFPDNYSGANYYGYSVTDILDYANTNKYKTTRSQFGYDIASGTYFRSAFGSGNWRSLNAITSIKLRPNLAINFSVGSHFALYGIKGV